MNCRRNVGISVASGPKAFVRSKLWDPDTWLDPATLPTSAEVALAHQRNPELTLEQVEQREREALAKRLA